MKIDWTEHLNRFLETYLQTLAIGTVVLFVGIIASLAHDIAKQLISGAPVALISSWILAYLYIICCIFLWIVATVTAIIVIVGMYSSSATASKTFVAASIVISVATFIIGFAVAYLRIYEADRAAFSFAKSGDALTVISALYFSVVTFATVGYGDIAPVSDVARLTATAEIIFSLLYTVLIFSALGGFIRAGRGRGASPLAGPGRPAPW